MENKDLLHKFVQYPRANEIAYVYDVDKNLEETYPLSIYFVGERDGKAHAHKDVWPSTAFVRNRAGEDYLIINSEDVTYAEKRALIDVVFREE
jgi:hypothetical protein